MTEIKPCPVCGWDDVKTQRRDLPHHRSPGIIQGNTYRYRIIACNSCGWGVEVQVQYAEDFEAIRAKCLVEWNDRRTWKERQHD